MNTDAKIAIIGAGVSGLAGASRLTRAGFRNITIFEARREAGGRTRSYVDPTTGDTLDNGQHLMMGCYTSTLDYLRWCGTDKLVEKQPLTIPFHTTTGEYLLRIPGFGPPFNLLTGLWRTRLLTPIEKAAATRLGNSILRNKLPANYQDMTCERLFSVTWQPDGLVEKLWAPLVLATINASVKEASALLFANVIREAFFASRTSSALLVPQVGLSELLVAPAVKNLERSGIEIKYGSPVRSIEEKNDRYEIEGSIFDAVLAAAPLGPIGLISPIREPASSIIVNAYFWLDREIVEDPINSFVGTTLQWAFPKPSGYAKQRLALTVSAANDLSERTNEEIRDILWHDLMTTIPEADGASLVHYQIIREKRATPLFTPNAQHNRPNAMTDFSRFVLAGDLVQNGLPATIEGAVRNGYAAAEILMAA